MKIGIDLISFHTPAYFLDLRILAQKRGVDPEKAVGAIISGFCREVGARAAVGVGLGPGAGRRTCAHVSRARARASVCVPARAPVRPKRPAAQRASGSAESASTARIEGRILSTCTGAIRSLVEFIFGGRSGPTAPEKVALTRRRRHRRRSVAGEIAPVQFRSRGDPGARRRLGRNRSKTSRAWDPSSSPDAPPSQRDRHPR